MLFNIMVNNRNLLKTPITLDNARQRLAEIAQSGRLDHVKEFGIVADTRDVWECTSSPSGNFEVFDFDAEETVDPADETVSEPAYGLYFLRETQAVALPVKDHWAQELATYDAGCRRRNRASRFYRR